MASMLPLLPDPPVEPLDPSTSPAMASPHHPGGRVVGRYNHGTVAVASPLTASSPPPPQQSDARTCVHREEEWEIKQIVGKRRAEKGYEYWVCWEESMAAQKRIGKRSAIGTGVRGERTATA